MALRDCQRLRRAAFLTLTLALTLPARMFAQTEPITSPPPNIIIPNYNGVPSGPLGGLEGNANVARATDTSAPWFNPAGLSKAGTQVSGSAGTYKLTTVSPKFLPTNGGSTQQIPNLVGATAKLGQFTVGFTLVTTIAWNQGTDTDDVFTDPEGNPERYAFSADSGLNQQVSAAAVGYDIGNKWHVGAGLAIQKTDIRSAQIISDRITDSQTVRTLLVSSRASGSSDVLRAIIGVQVEPTPTIRIGGVIRTSGFQFNRSGSITLDSTLDGTIESIGASIFDTGAQFDYKLPLESAVGVAYVRKRAEVEIDVQGYSSVPAHALLAPSEPLTIYNDPGNGGKPTITQQPLSPLVTESRGVVNYLIGGHVQPFESRPLLVHAGVATDHSPVTSADEVFDEVNFVVWSVGVSGSISKLSFALGVNYRRGSSDNITLRNLLSEPIQTSIGVRTVGLTYSVNYKF